MYNEIDYLLVKLLTKVSANTSTQQTTTHPCTVVSNGHNNLMKPSMSNRFSIMPIFAVACCPSQHRLECSTKTPRSYITENDKLNDIAWRLRLGHPCLSFWLVKRTARPVAAHALFPAASAYMHAYKSIMFSAQVYRASNVLDFIMLCAARVRIVIWLERHTR